MAKKIIQRLLPDPATIKKIRLLNALGHRIHDPNLWHLNRRSAAAAAFVGLFSAFIPIPIQMFIAAALAVVVRCNLPISVALVWITNPVTIPPMFYFAYRLGAWVMGIPDEGTAIELSWQWLETSLEGMWQPLLLGSLICGLSAGSIGYLAMKLFWRWHVVHNWKKRQQQKNKA